jgi:23S rRNA pseudouridine1911/1915/1917 synthase
MPSPAAGRIESRLRENAAGVLESARSGPGRRAVTHYSTLRRHGRGALVECRLETGRRNQIRVHLAELGCPVVGDRKYGHRPAKGEPRTGLMLHSWTVRLHHPVGGHEIMICAEVPEGFPEP